MRGPLPAICRVILPPMSSPESLDIDYIARLARIALTPEEKTKFAQQLGDVLHHARQLGKVDVAGLEPTAHAFPVENIWDDDMVRPGLPVELALKNAPARRENMISVPKVVE